MDLYKGLMYRSEGKVSLEGIKCHMGLKWFSFNSVVCTVKVCFIQWKNGQLIMYRRILANILLFIYICDMKRIVVFDMSERKFEIYKDVPQAALRTGIGESRLRYHLSRENVYYTGSCFVGYGEDHKSKRGRK